MIISVGDEIPYDIFIDRHEYSDVLGLLMRIYIVSYAIIHLWAFLFESTQL